MDLQQRLTSQLIGSMPTACVIYIYWDELQDEGVEYMTDYSYGNSASSMGSSSLAVQ